MRPAEDCLVSHEALILWSSWGTFLFRKPPSDDPMFRDDWSSDDPSGRALPRESLFQTPPPPAAFFFGRAGLGRPPRARKSFFPLLV